VKLCHEVLKTVGLSIKLKVWKWIRLNSLWMFKGKKKRKRKVDCTHLWGICSNTSYYYRILPESREIRI
jgi:hypothetical protein